MKQRYDVVVQGLRCKLIPALGGFFFQFRLYTIPVCWAVIGAKTTGIPRGDRQTPSSSTTLKASSGGVPSLIHQLS